MVDMKYLLGSCLLLACLVSAQEQPPQETPTFRTGVAEVRVDVQVNDGKHNVDGLTKDDFVLFDNGRPVTVQHFSQNSEPLDIVLLFDISGSMRPKVQEAISTAGAALGELRQGDRVAVWTFHDRTRTLQAFTTDLHAVQTILEWDLLSLFYGGGTMIQGAADNVARFFINQPKSDRRRAVLVITDDDGERSMKDKELLDHFWQANALLAELIIPDPPGVEDFRRYNRQTERGTLKVVIEKTGGEALVADQEGGAGAGFQRMMQGIRQRYALYYPMPSGKPGEYHEIKLDLTAAARKKIPNAKLLSSKGYILPEN
jgi:Ca-activated chloride channel family protein